MGAQRKYSVTLQGHRTSVSLEPAFWQELQRLAERKKISVNRLVAEIDGKRLGPTATSQGLSSALRVYVLDCLKREIDDHQACAKDA